MKPYIHKTCYIISKFIIKQNQVLLYLIKNLTKTMTDINYEIKL
jgi:hypothetical protein